MKAFMDTVPGFYPLYLPSPHLSFKAPLHTQASSILPPASPSAKIPFVVLHSYFLQIQTYPLGERRESHKTQKAQKPENNEALSSSHRQQTVGEERRSSGSDLKVVQRIPGLHFSQNASHAGVGFLTVQLAMSPLFP